MGGKIRGTLVCGNSGRDERVAGEEGLMGNGLKERKNGSSYGRRAVLTGLLLKLPLMNALQPVEKPRTRH